MSNKVKRASGKLRAVAWLALMMCALAFAVEAMARHEIDLGGGDINGEATLAGENLRNGFPLHRLASIIQSPRAMDDSRVAPQAVPTDFEDALVTNIGGPTALAFTPDGRMLIATQGGTLRIYQNGALVATPALTLGSRVCTNSERGLLGVAVDPQFAMNRYVYLFYTFNKFNTCPTGQPTNANNPVNRVSRFVLSDSNTINLSSETILVDNMPSPAGNHNAGDLGFGKDGFLYISIGDGGCDYAGDSGCAGENDAARDRHVLTGKILRITRDGGIPPGNPFQGASTARCNVTGRTTAGNTCQEIYATGLRNPFRFAFDPNAQTTRFFINDVGQNAREEIDEGLAGADYGWNIREGRCANGGSNCGSAPPAGLTDPVYDYDRSQGCASITGGAFVPRGIWPAAYDDAYLYGDFVCGRIFRLNPNGAGGYAASDFATGLGGSSAVHLTFGPYQSTQALYYTTYAGGGQVRRIRFTGTTNRNPVAVASANPTSGAAPLNVNFNASSSTDPDGDALTYEWSFGDGTPNATAANVTHVYANAGTYTATLTVRDGRDGTATATVRIDVGNTAPVPQIIAPTTSKLFRVGETITLQGSATDVQDGALADSRLSWRVLFHHNNDHTHPYVPPTAGNNITFTAPPPEDLAAATGSFLEIFLTATDSNGLSTTVSQILNPRRVNITFATEPAGLRIEINGTTITAPHTLVSWDGYILNVNAPAQLDGAGRAFEFASWSDGGAATHAITTPASAATYTAVFRTTAAPQLLTEEGTERAIALNAVTWTRDPFALTTEHFFNSDRRTRVALFAVNARLVTGEDVSAMTVQAEDAQGRIYPLAVEFVGQVPVHDWLTQIIVRLPDELAGVSEVWVRVSLRGQTSNRALIGLRHP